MVKIIFAVMRYIIAVDCISIECNYATFFSPMEKVSKLKTRISVAVLALQQKTHGKSKQTNPERDCH